RRSEENPVTVSKTRTSSGPKAIQDAILPEGFEAVRLSAECQSLEELQQELLKKLGQNSLETRKRYSQSILKWFFADGIDGLLPRVWRAYSDEAIVNDLLRYSYLVQEPLMGACVADALFPLENGLVIPPSYFDKFLTDFLRETPPEKT